MTFISILGMCLNEDTTARLQGHNKTKMFMASPHAVIRLSRDQFWTRHSNLLTIPYQLRAVNV